MRRGDAESVYRAVDDTLDLNRAHSEEHLRQTADLLGASGATISVGIGVDSIGSREGLRGRVYATRPADPSGAVKGSPSRAHSSMPPSTL